jgi:hypothetical protein
MLEIIMVFMALDLLVLLRVVFLWGVARGELNEYRRRR